MPSAAAIDIGTNSVRLLVVDGDGREVGRLERVTGLGRGLGTVGRLDGDAVIRTLGVLGEYAEVIRAGRVELVRAVATSAARDAPDRDDFLGRAEAVLGMRPVIVTGDEEAALSHAGATSDPPGPPPHLVVDIGGGSTELVWDEDGAVRGMSIDIGSVRLTDRLLPDRPATFDQLAAASRHLEARLGEVDPPEGILTVIGVAGTWTSLAAIHLGLETYDRERVHHSVLDRLEVDRLVERLAGLTVEQTAAIPGLDPGRAPVILAGALVARECMRRLSAGEVAVSERDLLDGVILSLRREAAG